MVKVNTDIQGQGQDSGCLSALPQVDPVHQFKWNQQSSRLLEQLTALYNHRQDTGLQPDVALFSNDGTCVEAHRMVLSLCSGYFQNLFVKVNLATSLKMKDGPAVIVLEKVKTHQLQQILQFMYTGEVAVPSDQLEEFLEIGRSFQIGEIMDYKSFLESSSPTVIKPMTLAGISEDDNESRVAPVASSSTLYEHVPDENIHISYDIYKMKVEEEAEVTLDPVVDHDNTDHDKISNESEEEYQPSSESDKEDNDSTYEEETLKTKPKRRRKIMESPSSIDGVSGKNRSNVDWQVQKPVSDETLKLEWRINNRKNFESGGGSINYYCAFGGRACPSKLKKKILKDGTVVWLNNKRAHNRHSLQAQQENEWELVDPVPDDILLLNWRIERNHRLESSFATTYYCVIGGRQCPARLKKKVLNDGTVVWLDNQVPHNFHLDTSLGSITLTPEQSQLIWQCLDSGITSPNDIILKFKVQGLTPPEEQHLRAFLRIHRRKNLQ